MNTRAPYDTLLGKSKDTIVRELEQLIGAAEIALAEGSRWLISQRAPVGPLMAEHDVSYVYKCVWAHYMAGSDGHYVTELLDWLMEHARQPNGDLFFPTEPPDHRNDVRVYRALVCLRIAALTGHPMAQDAQVVQRALQYQDAVTGGCCYFLGEDPDHPQWPEFIGVGETVFLGEFAIAANLRQQAIRAGDWLRKMVQDNQSHMTGEGIFYCLADREGALITQVAAGEKIFKMVNNWDSIQGGWIIGCAMAYLADLYDTMREKWDYSAAEAQPYLDAALALAAFEDTMPLYTYFFISKCKVIWGASALIRVLLKYGLGRLEDFDRLYRQAKQVFVYTFLGTQLPDGSWPAEHYPLRDDAPEAQFDYRVLKGLSLIPAQPIEGSATSSYAPATEITGEFVAEIGTLLEGMRPLLAHYRTM